MPNIMHWPIGSLKPQCGLASFRQSHTSLKDQVEDDGSARFRLAPDAEVLIELLMQTLFIGCSANGKAHGRCRSHVGRTADLAPKALLQDTGNWRKFRSPSR